MTSFGYLRWWVILSLLWIAGATAITALSTAIESTNECEFIIDDFSICLSALRGSIAHVDLNYELILLPPAALAACIVLISVFLAIGRQLISK